MKTCCFAASILLPSLRLASVEAVATDSANCSQKPQPGNPGR